MAIIYYRQKKCLQNVSLNFSVNLWSTLGSQSIHTQSSAITINPSRLTAGPLMSKHALWQIYGYMGNTAKLSRMYFFYALSSSSERTSKVRIICSKIFADVQTWCWIDWDLASKEFLALEEKKEYRFIWGSNRIIYNISIQSVNQTSPFLFLHTQGKQQDNKKTNQQ